MPDPHPLLEPLLALHNNIRDRVVEACTQQTTDALAEVAADGAGDTIYRIDRVSEEMLIEGLLEVAQREPLCLVAEGLPGGKRVLPNGAREGDCRWRLLVDPIDGTRGLMYQKRSAWILTGVAPDKGDGTRLRDIELAVQTEIPLVKQHLSDQLWARRGGGMHAHRFNRLSRTTRDVSLRPSRADNIAHGFATVVRFFPGAREILGGESELRPQLSSFGCLRAQRRGFCGLFPKLADFVPEPGQFERVRTGIGRSDSMAFKLLDLLVQFGAVAGAGLRRFQFVPLPGKLSPKKNV